MLDHIQLEPRENQKAIKRNGNPTMQRALSGKIKEIKRSHTHTQGAPKTTPTRARLLQRPAKHTEGHKTQRFSQDNFISNFEIIASDSLLMLHLSIKHKRMREGTQGFLSLAFPLK